jgi:hypothetical protein
MSEPSPADPLWSLVRGAMATKALGVVADLGVADALSKSPRPVGDLATELGVDDDTLYRFLRALASDGVFVEEPPRVFANTPTSELLQEGHPARWRDFAHLFGDAWFRAFADAGQALHDGQATFPRTFATDFWTWLKERPDEGAAFNRAMAGGADWKADSFAAAGWRGDETVVDVGGGNGALLIELLRRRTTLHGVVFDLPETAAEAEARVAEAGLEDRCTVVAGSFFDAVPAGDVYLLSSILHDWNDERAHAILRTVRTAAPSHARLLIRDAVIPADNSPHRNKWLDLLMLVLAGGRERSEADWRDLLTSAGFEPERIEDGLIEARPLATA